MYTRSRTMSIAPTTPPTTPPMMAPRFVELFEEVPSAPGETGTTAVGVITEVDVLVTTMTEPPGSVEDDVITLRDVVGGSVEVVEEAAEEEEDDGGGEVVEEEEEEVSLVATLSDRQCRATLLRELSTVRAQHETQWSRGAHGLSSADNRVGQSNQVSMSLIAEGISLESSLADIADVTYAEHDLLQLLHLCKTLQMAMTTKTTTTTSKAVTVANIARAKNAAAWLSLTSAFDPPLIDRRAGVQLQLATTFNFILMISATYDQSTNAKRCDYHSVKRHSAKVTYQLTARIQPHSHCMLPPITAQYDPELQYQPSFVGVTGYHLCPPPLTPRDPHSSDKVDSSPCANGTSMVSNSTTYGALLVGGLIALFLSGIVATQVFLYRRSYPDDRLRNKVMVSAVWLLDLLHSAFIIASLFRYVMLGLVDVHSIQTIAWTVSVTISITGVLTFLVHCFFTIRVWTLSKHNKWLCGLIVRPPLSSLRDFVPDSHPGRVGVRKDGTHASIPPVSAFGTVAQMQRFHTWRAFHQGAAWIFTTGLGISATVDFLIAFSILWFLGRSRTGFSSMDQIIDVIIVYTVENGLLTSMCTVASFVCWVTMPHNFIFLGLHFAIGKLYANSFLATLNARAHIKERTTSSREQRHSYRMPTISGWSRKSMRRDLSSRCDHVSSTIVQVNIEKTVVTDGLANTPDGDGDIDSIIPAYMAKRASTDTPFADLYSTRT
ncbi:hypothetical protein NM688_g7834 [Phlebia brevispora]|uniref:Uncharacterized protein n=1 Tax=Phlebia brevispora TaxID=194682 RepID=A0ACC1S0V7_9APHY|nr:hypothetical protein NM688_g7834 [Phlebia brevispora]